ncbi:ABC transporter permease [uncultured Sanguibacteroides sp.]|uniref:ABC transporter permease n=1 Tax=uncultured Sanguibacteroides sp. TaxID=1635151 RepID=UPI0025CDB8C8|nr:ABC transporter permease [uncultured Sanguibacteroides sp.]
MLRYLIEKEFKQLKRNSFLPRLILIFPCMMMLVMPWAATLEIEDLRLAIIDNDHSPSSDRLIHRIEASRYFKLTELPSTYAKGLKAIEKDRADMLLEIPRGFEKEQANERPSSVLIAVNAVNGTKGGLGSAYLQQILTPQNTSTSIRYQFNPHLNYKVFMVPALMTMILVMLCGFLPALNVVSEKEAGTIEQINVTPISRFTFTLAKLLPYWIIGFVILNLCIGLAWLIYGLTPEGSIFTIYIATLIFILVVSGLGLVISNHSATMQQAMFVMWFCMLIFILMSGLFTPISSMPQWAQYITYANPLRYFMEIMRTVYLKGSGIGDITLQLGVLGSFAVGLYCWAIYSYRKQQ